MDVKHYGQKCPCVNGACDYGCPGCTCTDEWKLTQQRYVVGPLTVRADAKQIGGVHYKTLAIQPSVYIRRNKIGWYEGNAIKYITRHSIKGGRQDIEKAIHYLELLLEEDYGSTPQETK